MDVEQGAKPGTYWATDGFLRVDNHLGDGAYPLWSRYPSFRNIGLAMGAIYGNDVALNPKDIYDMHRLLSSAPG